MFRAPVHRTITRHRGDRHPRRLRREQCRRPHRQGLAADLDHREDTGVPGRRPARGPGEVPDHVQHRRHLQGDRRLQPDRRHPAGNGLSRNAV